MSYKQQGGMASSSVHDEHVAPVPEHIEGVVFPYRGIENHGVKPAGPVPEYVDDQWPEDDESPHYAQGPTEAEPLPVIVVNQYKREFQKIRAFTAYASDQNGNPSCIVGRVDPSYKRVVHLQNQHATLTVTIGSGEQINANNGYQIRPNSELSFPLTCDSEIWAVSSNGSQVPVGVLIEFSTEL